MTKRVDPTRGMIVHLSEGKSVEVKADGELWIRDNQFNQTMRFPKEDALRIAQMIAWSEKKRRDALTNRAIGEMRQRGR